MPTTLTRMIDYNVILQKLKAFQTKYGNDFDANLGKLNLLAECTRAVLACKQLHGSLATVRQRHPDYGTASMVTRANMHQFVRVMSPGTAKPGRR